MSKHKNKKDKVKSEEINKITITSEISKEEIKQIIIDANLYIENSKKNSITIEWMKFLIFPIMLFLGIFCAFFSIYTFINAIKYSVVANDFLKLILYFFLSMFSTGLSFLTFLSLKEILKEKDKQFITDLFSNIVAMIALIIAIIALIHEI